MRRLQFQKLVRLSAGRGRIIVEAHGDGGSEAIREIPDEEATKAEWVNVPVCKYEPPGYR